MWMQSNRESKIRDCNYILNINIINSMCVFFVSRKISCLSFVKLRLLFRSGFSDVYSDLLRKKLQYFFSEYIFK